MTAAADRAGSPCGPARRLARRSTETIATPRGRSAVAENHRSRLIQEELQKGLHFRRRPHTSAVGVGGRRPSRSQSVTAATQWFRRPLARETIRKGRREIARDEAPTDRIRRLGGGRPRIQQDQPGIQAALEALVDPLTRGDPTSPLRWTCKSRAKLAAGLTEQGWRVSSTTVGRLLHRLGYRLQSPGKRQEGATHPDRNAQFEHINQTADKHLRAGQPVISVDTKKKELVGNFKNGGREWQPKGTPPAVLVHDFPTDAEGKAIPYGV